MVTDDIEVQCSSLAYYVNMMIDIMEQPDEVYYYIINQQMRHIGEIWKLEIVCLH